MNKKIVSLFSGIGGLEYGFLKQGFETILFCENDPSAQAILKKQFTGVPLAPDVSELKRIPACEILLAGFPCQDLSQAGRKIGIGGLKSGLVEHLFRLISSARPKPKWIVIENVPYMLSLDSGKAMSYLVSELERLGYAWAYRTIDARSFGTPQRRPRIVLVASRTEDPRGVLFSEDSFPGDLDGKPSEINENNWYGFYWTEGSRGVGWVKEGVPPIKGGSSIGIASPPAIWIPKRNFFGTIGIRDAERFQGFDPDWTLGDESQKRNARWRLVGNAVNTNVSKWLARQIEISPRYEPVNASILAGKKWPKAAWGKAGKVYDAKVSAWPEVMQRPKLREFLLEPLKPLSFRATRGFISRAHTCTNIVYAERFLNSLQMHADLME